MSRKNFLTVLIRIILTGVLITIGLVTGSRAASAANCAECPGKGICGGETDCSSFITK
jgi:hypothetical protein